MTFYTMRRYILLLAPALLAFLFAACDSGLTETATTADAGALDAKKTRVTICHYSKGDDMFYRIEINRNATGHRNHGDLRFNPDDTDTDGSDGDIYCEPLDCPCYNEEDLAAIDFECYTGGVPFVTDIVLLPQFTGVCLADEIVCGGAYLCAYNGSIIPGITESEAEVCEELAIEAIEEQSLVECSTLGPTLQAPADVSPWRR